MGQEVSHIEEVLREAIFCLRSLSIDSQPIATFFETGRYDTYSSWVYTVEGYDVVFCIFRNGHNLLGLLEYLRDQISEVIPSQLQKIIF